MSDHQLHEHTVWPVALRWFHWINFICIMALMILGLIILNKTALGISSDEAKAQLKVVHVIIGYVFVLNLLLRFLLGFFGPAWMRWSKVLPGKGFAAELKRFQAAEVAGRGHTWVGHNPKARLALSLMYLLFFSMAVTGLVRAGTDIYFPPLGGYFAAQVAAEGVDPDSLVPYDKSNVDPQAYKALGEFKGIWGDIHLYGSYLLMALIVLHVFVVVRVETRHRGSIIASMFSGKKIFAGEPGDK